MHDLSSSSATNRSEFPLAAFPATMAARPPVEAIDFPAAILDEDGFVSEANEAWRANPAYAAPVGQRYLDGLRGSVPMNPDEFVTLQHLLSPEATPGAIVTNMTIGCHSHDSEHWISVNISTMTVGGRRAFLALHQDTTALRQMERRCRLAQRLAAEQAVPQDPSLRVRRLAVTVGEVLHASVVVLWERESSGVLRARPLESSRVAPQVATIAHTSQLLAVMDGHTAQWIRLIDGTPCFAVPLRVRAQVVLFHFPRRPRFDADTLRLVARALQSDPSLREPPPPRSRSPREIRRQLTVTPAPASTSLAQQERQHIVRTLTRCGNNVLRTARALGIARSTLYERFKDYGITVPPRTE